MLPGLLETSSITSDAADTLHTEQRTSLMQGQGTSTALYVVGGGHISIQCRNTLQQRASNFTKELPLQDPHKVDHPSHKTLTKWFLFKSQDTH